jgi:hypothetical protein
MDIQFNDLVVTRMIMHTIIAKLENQDRATVDPDDEQELLATDDEVIITIKKRLIDAAGKSSKAFTLELDDDYQSQGTFYQLCHGLKPKSDADFIRTSRAIAELLAYTQTRTNIPGGYMIFLECENQGKAIYIVIKAEPHEALQKLQGQSHLSLLKKVFLSPSQRLYKIGILAEKQEATGATPNDLYDCFLFDDQFRLISHPAEYFYKEFLGFSVGNNAKIQSERFYDKTENFIIEKVEDLDTKSDLLQTLRNEFITNQNATLTPEEFARTYMPTPALRDEYIGEIVHELPPTIVKDDTLLKNRINKRKVDFPSNIKLTGPNDVFDDSVQFIHNIDELERSIEDEGEFTIIKIKGVPYKS